MPAEPAARPLPPADQVLYGTALRQLYPVSAYLEAAAEADLDKEAMFVVAHLIAAVTGADFVVVLATIELMAKTRQDPR